MPSPVGHSIMGYIIYRAAAKRAGMHQWQLMALYLFAANVADLDFIPGLQMGDPDRYHHGITHSIGFAVLFALVFSLLGILGNAFRKNFGIFFLLYFSHIAFDYFSIDTSKPYGEPFFWPLTNDYYIAPFAFLPDIQRSAIGSEFIPSLFSLHNLWAVSVECLLLFPLAMVTLALRRKTKASTEMA